MSKLGMDELCFTRANWEQENREQRERMLAEAERIARPAAPFRTGGPKFARGAKVLALLNGAWIPAVVVSYIYRGDYKVCPRYLPPYPETPWNELPVLHRRHLRRQEETDG